MYAEGIEQLLKANKGFTAPLGEWNKVSADLGRRLLEQNLELLSDDLEIISENFSLLSDQLRRVSHVKKPDELMNVVRDCMNENINTSIENSQRLLRSTMEHFQEAVKACGIMQEESLKTVRKEKEREKERG